MLYFVKFIKGGKILGQVQGQEWPYAATGEVYEDKSVPNDPKLKITINREEKLLNLVFESGRRALSCPMIRAKFRLPCED